MSVIIKATLSSLLMVFSGFLAATVAPAQTNGDWRGINPRGIHYAVPRNTLHPDRWREGLQHAPDCQAPCVVEFDDRLSTIYLRYKWMQLNPKNGVYDFSDLGQVIDTIHRAGKKVSLIVMAGKYTPGWVFDDGARHIETRALLFHGSYAQELVPVTWDPIFLAAHGEMIEALAAFLREKPERYDTITLVKNGGLVIHSGETRMLPPHAFFRGTKRASEEQKDEYRKELCSVWAQAGYTQDKILRAAAQTMSQIAEAFPDKYLGLVFVGGSRRFPTVNAAGKCTYPQRNTTGNTIIKQMVAIYGKRAIFNETTLAAGGVGQPRILQWVISNGGNIAFQLNAQMVGCRSSNAPCDKASFKEAVQEGFDARAVFIEVHDGNIHRYRRILPGLNAALAGR